MIKPLISASLLLAAAVCSAQVSAAASVIRLDFSELGDSEAIENFYNGDNPGVDYGISFSPNAFVNLSTIENAYFEGEPTPPAVGGFFEAESYVNVMGGFTEGFSFYYSTIEYSGSVGIYDGLNGAGNLLASFQLSALGEGPNPDKPYANWAVGSASFAGTAKSVHFGVPTIGDLGFDNMTFGSIDPTIPAVPELPSAVLLALGLGILVSLRRRISA